MGVILIIIEKTTYLVIRARVLEKLYTAETIQTQISEHHHLLKQFREDLVRLYTAILSALATCYSKLSRSSAGRAIKAVFQPEKMQSLLDDLCQLEMRIQHGALACEALRSQTSANHLEQLLTKLDAPLFRIEEQTSRVLTEVTAHEHREILNWISTILFGNHHQEISRKRTKDTGEWLLQHARFKEWHSTSSSAVTLIYGIRKYTFRSAVLLKV